jgi:hypothetical protein
MAEDERGGSFTVLLIDDRDYALPQIEAAIPAHLRERCHVRHLSSFAQYRAEGLPRAKIVLLDYFLDLDRTVGELVAHEVQAEHLVGFSSEASCSAAIVEAALRAHGEGARTRVHAVRKLQGVDRNRELEELFTRILG